MLINSLRLKNFKRFERTDVDFSDGVTGVIGSNGSGKSTFVEAILFALYGIKASGLEGEHIISSFADADDTCEVALDFTIGGAEYTIQRSYKRGRKSSRHDAQISLNGTLLADGVSAVDEEIRRLFGMGGVDFRNTIYAGQKDLLSLLDETPGERKKWFLKVLGIDFLKNECDAELKDEADLLDKEIGRIEFYIHEKDTGLMEAEAEGLEEKMSHLKKEITSLGCKCEETESLKTESYARLRRLMDLRREEDSLLIRLEQLAGKKADNIEQRKKYAEKISTLLSYEEELKRMGPVNEIYRQAEETLEQEREAGQRSQRLSADLARLHSDRGRLQKRHADLSSRTLEMKEDEKRCARLKPEIREREKLLLKHEELREKEPAYRDLIQKNVGKKAEYKNLSSRAEEIRKEMEECDAALRSCTSKETGAEMKRSLDHIDTIKKRIGGISAETSHIKREISLIHTQKDLICSTGKEGKCPTCHRPLGEHYPMLIQEYNESETLHLQRKDALEEERKNIYSELEKHENKYNSLQKCQNELIQTEEKRQRLAEERTSLIKKVEECLLKEEEIKKAIAKLGYSDEEKTGLERKINTLDSSYRTWLEVNERLRKRDEIIKELLSAEEECRSLQESIRETEKTLSEISYNEGRHEEAKVAYAHAKQAQMRCTELSTRVERIPELRSLLKEAEEAFDRILEEEVRTEKARDKVHIAPGEIEEAEQAHKNIESVLRRASEDLAAGRAKFALIQEKLQKAQKEMAELKDYRSRHSELTDNLTIARSTRRIISDYIIYLLSIVRHGIEGEVSRVLGEITDGRYDHVTIDEEFNVRVSDLGESYPSERFSGGEQDDIAIALRIALSRYISGLHRYHENTFLIFDEIFGSQDEERRGSLIRALRTQEAFFPQIFLISHIAEIQGEFGHTLLVEMSDDRRSRIMELSA